MLGIEVEQARLGEFVEAATLDSMRARAAVTVPDSDITAWRELATFFSVGGRRAWGTLLSEDDLENFRRRLRDLVGPDLADWLAREP